MATPAEGEQRADRPDSGAAPGLPSTRPPGRWFAWGGVFARSERSERLAPLLGAALVLGLAVVLGAPLPGEGYGLAPGNPSPRDYEAPRAMSYASAVRSEQARAAAAARAEPVYQLDSARVDAQLLRVREVMDHLGRLRRMPDFSMSAADRRAWVAQIPELAGLAVERLDPLLAPGGEGSLDDEAWAVVQQEVSLVVAQAMRQQIRPDNHAATIETLIEKVGPRVDNATARLVADLAGPFVSVNTAEDPAATEARRQAARDKTAPVEVAYAAGETIVRQGEVLTAAQLEALQVAGIRGAGFGSRGLLALVALLGLLVAVLAAALLRLDPRFWRRPRALGMAVLLILAFTAGARLSAAAMPGELGYAYPAAAAPMVLSVLLGFPTGVLASVLLAVAIGLVGGPHADMALYVFIGGMAGALALGRVERLKAFLVAAVVVGGVNALSLASLQLLSPEAGTGPASVWLGAALVNGALSAGLAALGVLAAGPLFGVTTSLQLLELLRPDHPLLHELQLKAPGTYQHSVVLGNLGEAAANAIGADALLVRAGAFYHDLGKSLRPYFFVENQLGGVNPHDGLEPVASARIILSHVPDGAELARRYGLPESVVQFIWQHHGTTRVEYFYGRALERAEGEPVDEARFRYPGPRPQTREAAILMLADGTEALVRAQNPSTPEEIDALVEQLIQNRLEEGQLDDCELTLRDLRRIRRAFGHTLRSMYHPRVRYPAGIRPLRPEEPAGAIPRVG